MNLSKYLAVLGAVVLTVSACGTTEKIVYMPVETDAPQTTKPVPERTLTDEEQFVMDVYDLYEGVIYVDDQMLIDAGYETCRLFRQGATLQDVIDVLNESSGGDPQVYELLSAVVTAAVFDFCPDQQYKFDSGV
jgi:hypothetical protein